MGASRGIGRAIAAALAREGASVAIASRSQEKLEEAAAEIGERGDAVRRRCRRPRSPRGAAGRGRPSELGPIEILVTQHRRPAVRRRPRPRARRLGERLPLARPRAARARRRRRAGNARARLGADRQRRLQLDPRADPRPQPLQRPPHGRGRLPQDALARGRRRRDHRQHRRHRPLRHRTPRRRQRLPRGRRRGGASTKSRPPASASRRSTATSSPSSAPTAPPTSPAPSSPSTAACCARPSRATRGVRRRREPVRQPGALADEVTSACRDGRIEGKRITSRRFSTPARIIVRRSMPMPDPPAGNDPYSSARTNSSSLG